LREPAWFAYLRRLLERDYFIALAALKGGTAEENARAIRELFAGARSAFRDIVLLNAAAALVVAGETANLKDGVARGAAALDNGRAAAALEEARLQRNER